MRKTATHLLHHQGGNNTGLFLSEVILGGQDGLVNTLGVVLGLAAASNDLRIIVAGGLAGSIAEAVSMAAVGYTSTLAERDYYVSELRRERKEIDQLPMEEEQELRQIYEEKGFKGELLDEIVKVITSNKKVWLGTVMQDDLQIAPVKDGQPAKSAILIGISALIGSIISILPFLVFYILKIEYLSIKGLVIFLALGVSAATLFIAGVIKSRLTVGVWYRSGIQMLLIGIFSALVGYLVGLAFNQ